jgi:hypothetical protein
VNVGVNDFARIHKLYPFKIYQEFGI